MPIAATKKRQISWNRCAKTSEPQKQGVIVRRIALKSCPYCGGADELYLSRPESWRDEVCFFFFLQVVRCHSCMRRHYRPLCMQPVRIWNETKVVNNTNNEVKQQHSR
jgi:hypothetical protein